METRFLRGASWQISQVVLLFVGVALVGLGFGGAFPTLATRFKSTGEW